MSNIRQLPNLATDKIDLSIVKQFESLELLAKQVVEGFIIGLHKSPFHGFSVEFAEHRLYNTGESTRHIDWKIFARTDRLFVKRYEEETNLRCQLVLDVSSSMLYPGEQYNKLQFSIYCCAALIEMLKKQRDAIGLTLFDEKLLEFYKARSGAVHLKLLYSELEKLLRSNEHNHRTSAAETLHQIAEATHRRSLVILFSDMFDGSDDPEALFSALQHLKYNKHEVILFHVVDKATELDFEFDNRPYHFIDLETNEQIKVNPGQVREAYTDELSRYRKALKLRCSQFEIEYVEADIRQSFDQVLLPYIAMRTKLY